MSTPNRVIKKIPVAELPATLKALLSAFLEKGFSHAQTIDAFSADLTATCADCRLVFSGRELSQIVTDEKIGSFQKLARLSRGDCGRRDCPSAFYELAWVNPGTVPWETLWEGAESISQAVGPAQENAPTAVSVLQAASEKRKLILALVLAFLAVLAVYWRFRTPPWSSRPSTYQVDPQSVQSPGP